METVDVGKRVGATSEPHGDDPVALPFLSLVSGPGVPVLQGSVDVGLSVVCDEIGF